MQPADLAGDESWFINVATYVIGWDTLAGPGTARLPDGNGFASIAEDRILFP